MVAQIASECAKTSAHKAAEQATSATTAAAQALELVRCDAMKIPEAIAALQHVKAAAAAAAQHRHEAELHAQQAAAQAKPK